MTIGRKIVLAVLFLMFISAAVGHFVTPEKFVSIIPRAIPGKELIVMVTGVLEALAAVLLLLSATRKIGATIMLLLLLAYVPVHVNMCFDVATRLDVPVWGVWLRLVFQFILIYWAATFRMNQPKPQI